MKPTGYWKVTIAVTDDASKKVTFEARGDVPAISGNHIEGFKVSNRETSSFRRWEETVRRFLCSVDL